MDRMKPLPAIFLVNLEKIDGQPGSAVEPPNFLYRVTNMNGAVLADGIRPSWQMPCGLYRPAKIGLACYLDNADPKSLVLVDADEVPTALTPQD